MRSVAPNLNELTNYEYEIDPAGQSAGAKTLSMVGHNKRVLEIGAGWGPVTRHLAGTNHCEVTAVEFNLEAIEKLKHYCHRVYSCDLNDPSWTDVLQDDGKFDVVIAGDVLEHLYNPWAVLQSMKTLLKDTGSIILSLPHAGHCGVLSCLLDNDFEYREYGLLDKTHIRFFGVKNIESLYESAGLTIVEARFVLLRPEHTEFAERWDRLPAAMKRFLEKPRFSHVYQVVTKAVPSECADKTVDLMTLPIGKAPGSRRSRLGSVLRKLTGRSGI